MTKAIPWLLLASALGASSALAQAPVPEARVIDVDISRWGFNGDPDLILTVEEGELIELRFLYGDDTLDESNPHVMLIEGLNLESGLLDAQHRQTTIRFRPETIGTHKLRCIVPCHGHDQLDGGRVRVVPAGVAAAGIEPVVTAIALTATPPETAGHPAEVRARVTAGGGGTPLEGVTVEFAVRTTFMMSGWLVVGYARTDATGEAVLVFQPNRGGDQTVRARYAGSTRHLGVERTHNLAVPELVLTYGRETAPLVPGLGFWLLALVVGGIWFTYAFVAFQLRQLANDR
jgi:hypothetical protein